MIIRAPTDADVPAVTAMMNERGLALHGAREMTEEELRGWFTLPSIDRERDIRIALDGDVVVGYADLGDQADDGTRLWVDLRVPVDGRDDGAAPPLLDAMEARAREKAVPGAVIRAVADETDEPYRRLLERRGYRIVRSSYRMAVAFEGPPNAPDVPPGLEIRLFTDGEERPVYDAVMEAFRDGWDFTPQPFEEFVHWASMGDSDPSLWWVAEDGDELAGVCVCRGSAQGDVTRGWVDSLSVRRPWRGRGLGRALLLAAFVEFHRRGLQGCALSVDTENVTGAVRLYESVGMHETRRLDTYERPLDG